QVRCLTSVSYLSTILMIGVVVPETMTTSLGDGSILRIANCVSPPPTTTTASDEIPNSAATAGATLPNIAPESRKGGRIAASKSNSSNISPDHFFCATSYSNVSDACECS